MTYTQQAVLVIVFALNVAWWIFRAPRGKAMRDSNGPRVHEFKEQLDIGHAGESRIAAWLEGKGYTPVPTSFGLQQKGIDFELFRNGKPRGTVEVKTDHRAHQTGNAYIERKSVVPDGGGGEKLGWAYTCQADKLLYYVPGLDQVYVLQPDKLREEASQPHWREAKSLNDGYHSTGALVPLTHLAEIADSVHKVT